VCWSVLLFAVSSKIMDGRGSFDVSRLDCSGCTDTGSIVVIDDRS
jgi:hypothetical protein